MGPDDALRLADWVGGLFPEATPEVVTAVTQKILPSVVRLDVAQEI